MWKYVKICENMQCENVFSCAQSWKYKGYKAPICINFENIKLRAFLLYHHMMKIWRSSRAFFIAKINGDVSDAGQPNKQWMLAGWVSWFQYWILGRTQISFTFLIFSPTYSLYWNLSGYSLQVDVTHGSVARRDIKTICGRVRGCWEESWGRRPFGIARKGREGVHLTAYCSLYTF